MENLLKEFIVLENSEYYGDNAEYFVMKRDDFEYMPMCSTFDNYGNQCCHEEVCGEGEDHWYVEAHNWWDGSNWRTIYLGNDFGYKEANEEISKSILSNLPEIPYIEGAHETIKTEDYDYHFTRYPTPFICEVN